MTAKERSNDVTVDIGFVADQAADAVKTFFAPIRGAYSAVIGSTETPSAAPRQPGEALARYRRHAARHR